MSSPSDLAAERKIALQVVARLRTEFKHHFEVKPLLWEHEPLLATEHFQEGLISPADCEIVVCMFWSTLGSPLPLDKFVREDGSSGVTGTEYEFSIAREASVSKGAPEILVYRKTELLEIPINDREAVSRAQTELEKVDDFFDRYFHNDDEAKTFSNAYWSFADPSEFEDQLYTHLAEMLRRKASASSRMDGGSDVSWYRGSPYRGLQSFEIEHSDIFFGRSRSRNAIVQQFQAQVTAGNSFLMITGASGTGKSSLVKAGVLPVVMTPGVIPEVAECRWCIFKPSDFSGDLTTGLLRALTVPGALPELIPSDAEFAAVAERVVAGQHALESLIFATLNSIASTTGYQKHLKVRLLIVIDQFEELFALPGIGKANKAAFISLLTSLVNSGHTWIIATMRSDFYGECEGFPELVGMMRGNGQYHLGPPTQEELEQMIRLPAKAAGLSFEVNEDGIGLDAVLRESASDYPNILPLMSFTMQELYSRRTSHNQLCFSAYESLGGIEGAITKRASEIFEGMSPACQAELPAMLGALITVNPGDVGSANAKVAGWEFFQQPAAREQLVQGFIDARLIVIDEDPRDPRRKTVRIAHEALLTRWSRASKWIRDNQEFLIARARIFDSASYWNLEARPDSLLILDDKLLDTASELLEHNGSDVEPTVSDYISSSRHARERRLEAERAARTAVKRRKQRVVFSSLAIFVGLSILGVVMQNARLESKQLKEENALRAAEGEAASYVELAEKNLEDKNTILSISLALRALARPDTVSENLRIRAYSVINTALGEHAKSYTVARSSRFIPLTNLLLSEEDGWTVSSLQGSETILSIKSAVQPVLDQASGGSIAILSGGELQLWDTNPLQQRHALQDALPPSARFGFGVGGLIVYVVIDREVSLYDAQSGLQIGDALALSDVIDAVHVLDAEHAAISLAGGGTLLWRFGQGDAMPRALTLPVWDAGNRLTGTSNYETTISEFHQLSSERLLTRDETGVALLWDAMTAEFIAHAGSGEVRSADAAFFTNDDFMISRRAIDDAWVEVTYPTEGLALAYDVADESAAVVAIDAEGTFYYWTKTGELVARSAGPAILSEHDSVRLAVDNAGERAYLQTAGDSWILEFNVRDRIVRSPESIGIDDDNPANWRRRVVHWLEQDQPIAIAMPANLELLANDGSGEYMALTKDRTSIEVWSRDKHAPIAHVPIDGALERVELSANGQLVLLATADGAKLWDLQSHRVGREFQVGEQIVAADTTDAGDAVAIAYSNKVRVFDSQSPAHQEFEYGSPVTQLRFSSDGSHLAVALKSGIIEVLDGGSLDRRAILQAGSEIDELAIGAAGTPIAAWKSGSDQVHVWQSLQTGEPVTLLHWGPVQFVALNDNGVELATATEDGDLDIWNVGTGRHANRRSLAVPVEAVDFGPDGLRAYADTSASQTSVVRNDTGELVMQVDLPLGSIASFAASFDEAHLAALLVNGETLIWNVKSGQVVQSLRTGPGERAVPSFISSDEGPSRRDRAISGAVDSMDTLVDKPLSDGVLAFSPDGSRIAVQAAGDSPLYLFDRDDGSLVLSTEQGFRLAGFDMDSRYMIATSRTEPPKYWAADTGEEAHPGARVQPLLSDARSWLLTSSTRVEAVTPFSDQGSSADTPVGARLILDTDRDGRLLVRFENEIRVVDQANDQQLTIAYAGSEVAEARFSTDGDNVILISTDKATLVPVVRGRAVDAARQFTDAGL